MKQNTSKFRTFGAFVKKVKLHSVKAYQDSKAASKSAVAEFKGGYTEIQTLEAGPANTDVIDAEIVS